MLNTREKMTVCKDIYFPNQGLSEWQRAPPRCYFPGKQHVFRYFSVRLRRREGEKRKTPYGGSTRVLGEPAAVLYRLGSIINHWNLTKKKSRGFFRYHYYHRARCRKEKTIVSVKPRKLPSTNSSDWLVWGGMPRHGRPRIAAVCDACRRRKRSAAFERKGRLAAAAADAADGIGHAARSTRRRGAPCAHGAAPGQQQPANNPVLLPLSAALGGLSGPSSVARAPRSAVHPPSAAAAGLSGSRLFSSQAGSGTCPAGAAASSGAAPQGRHEAEIGAGAARERRKQAGKDVRKGPSLAEGAWAPQRILSRERLRER
jgi:hypothetical protein